MTAPLDIKKLREIAEAAQSDLAAGKTIWTDNLINYYHMTRPEAVLRLLDTIERYEAALNKIVTVSTHPVHWMDMAKLAREALRADAEEKKP